jgi:hypothetical protein
MDPRLPDLSSGLDSIICCAEFDKWNIDPRLVLAGL